MKNQRETQKDKENKATHLKSSLLVASSMGFEGLKPINCGKKSAVVTFVDATAFCLKVSAEFSMLGNKFNVVAGNLAVSGPAGLPKEGKDKKPNKRKSTPL